MCSEYYGTYTLGYKQVQQDGASGSQGHWAQHLQVRVRESTPQSCLWSLQQHFNTHTIHTSAQTHKNNKLS